MARTNLGKIVMIPKGTYSTTVTYSKLDVVTSNGSGYISKSDNNLNKPLTNETYWMKLVEKGDKGDKGDSYVITEADIQEIEDYVVDKTSDQIVSTRNELERVKNDVLETGTDTDTYIHLEDSAMAELQEIKVDGVLQQNTTTGKNKLDLEFSNESSILAGMTFTHTKSEFTLNGTATGTWGIFTLKNNLPIVDGKTYSLSANIEGTNPKMQITLKVFNGSNPLFSIPISKNSNYKNTVTVSFTDEITKCEFVFEDLTVGEVYNLTAEVQLEESSTPTSYEPYTGGQPSPSPDYPQEIKTITGSLKVTSCGKNLINSSAPSINTLGISFTNNGNGTYTISGTIPANKNINLDVTTSKPILQKGKTYTQVVETISGTKIGSIVPSFIKQDGSVIYNYFTDNQTRIPAEQLVNNAYNYYYSGAETEINWTFRVMLCEGSNATYEDYIESQIQAKLPESEFIGYINATNYDALSTKYNSNAGAYQLVLNKCIAKITIDGTKGSFSMPSAGRFNIDNIISNYLKTSQSYGITTKCDNYISFPQTSSNSDFDKLTSGYNYGIGLGGGTANNIRIKNVNFSNVEDFKNDLKQHPITLYYILNVKSRRTLDLGVIDMPLTYDEITNIFTDSDLLPTINAKYYRNFVTTVQNLQVNEKALKQELIDINARLSALESATTNLASESEVVE